MTDIERIERYISKTGKPGDQYDLRANEMLIINNYGCTIDNICLAFNYGRAKGLRAARAEVKKA